MRWGSLAGNILKTSCLSGCPPFSPHTCKGRQKCAKGCLLWITAVTAAVTLQAKEMLVHHEIMNGSRGFQEKVSFSCSSYCWLKNR